jgi:hypothetical protein
MNIQLGKKSLKIQVLYDLVSLELTFATGIYTWDSLLPNVGSMVISGNARTAQSSCSDWETYLASPSLRKNVNYCELEINELDTVPNTIRTYIEGEDLYRI